MFDIKDYFRKGFKFIIVGGIGAVVNWAILILLHQEFGVYYLTAEIIATFIAFGVNYNGNILLKNISIGKDAPSKTLPSPGIVKTEKVEDVVPGATPKTGT
jgi:hypothetical protein